MKLLVTDFDGTLYTDDYNKNIEALNKFKQKGNKIVIATGRYLSALKEDLDKRVDYDYLICTDGSIIYDNNDNVIYKELLDKESCEYVINQLRKLEEVNNIYCLNGDKLLDYDEYDNTNAIIASFEDRKVVEEYFENILKEVPSLHGYISTKWINITSKKVSKKTGRATGRPSTEYPSNWSEVYTAWKNGEVTAKVAMDQVGLKRTTFYKLAKEYELVK
jgi:hydroxymethylpyrimidine pyrophosphatase-like HAD family hydrolase